MKKIWSKIFLLQILFFGNSCNEKKFGGEIFCSKFVLLQNHYHGDRLDEKNFGRNIVLLNIFFLVENVWFKIISSETVRMKKNLVKKSLAENFFGRNFFCCIIISS
jgi:hypothetical protein